MTNLTQHQELAKRLCRNAYSEIYGSYFNSYYDGESESIKEDFESWNLTEQGFKNWMINEVLENKQFKEVKYAGREFIENEINNLLNKDNDWEEFRKAIWG